MEYSRWVAGGVGFEDENAVLMQEQKGPEEPRQGEACDKGNNKAFAGRGGFKEVHVSGMLGFGLMD